MQSGKYESILLSFVPSLTAGLQVADGQADGPPGQARVQQRRAAGEVKVETQRSVTGLLIVKHKCLVSKIVYRGRYKC